MRTLNLLLLNAGRRVELVHYLRAAFAKLGVAGRIITTDISPLNPAWYLGDARYILPKVEDSEAALVDCILDLCAREQVNVILPLIDLDLLTMARHRETFRARGVQVIVSGIRTIETSNDKREMSRFVQAQGFDTPALFDLDSAKAHGLPLFLKPRRGSGAADSHKLNSTDELEFYARRDPTALIQEYIQGIEYTTDIFSDWAGRAVVAVPRRRLKVKAGEVSIGKVERVPRLEAICLALADALESIGPMNIQAILRDNRFYVTDINARFGGGVPLSIEAGAPMLEWVVQMGLQEPLQTDNLKLDEGLVMMRYDQSTFFKPDELQAC